MVLCDRQSLKATVVVTNRQAGQSGGGDGDGGDGSGSGCMLAGPWRPQN